MKHDDSREHKLDQVKALCSHAILRCDEFAQAQLPPDMREALCEALMAHGAHLQLIVTYASAIGMKAELRVIERGEAKFKEPLLMLESSKQSKGWAGA